MSRTVCKFREIISDRKGEFLDRGLPGRYFFPHRAYYLPKSGPDGMIMAHRMCGIDDPNACWEIVLYATGSVAAEFPASLYFDDDLVWHQQQFGRIGQVATANLVVTNKCVYGNNYLSDLVQRISRRREHKTRIENRFAGWTFMLLNAILNFALEQRLDYIFSPTADSVLAQVPPARSVQRELFDRIYDRSVTARYHAVRRGKWWILDVRENRDRVVALTQGAEALSSDKVICICHDIERGFGHRGIDEPRARLADRIAPGSLTHMLHCEEAAGLKTTYNILGCLFDEVRSEIERNGHCLAFHSYDHQIRKYWQCTKHYYRARRLITALKGRNADAEYQDQLYRCRLLDKRVKGFRPPRSRSTAEWNDYNLVFRNFEWCATSARSLGTTEPVMHNHLVKIPIHYDDFSLYKSAVPFAQWERQALRTIEHNDFSVVGLHDCYADLWLSHYPAFVKKIQRLGTFKTFDQVANQTVLTHAL
jgi:hypothetical protein